MNIVFVGAHDWANEANRIARALTRSGRFHARCVTKYPHPFKYEEDIVTTRDGYAVAVEAIRKADWLITTGDGDYDTVKEWFDFKPKAHRACMHVGAAYRENPGMYDSHDGNLDMEHRFICADLLRFALGDPRTRTYVIPPESIVDRPFPVASPLEVLHTPSSPERKRTDLVDASVKGLAGIRYTKITGQPFAASWAARAGKHIFIDHLAPEYGAFGGAAAESAAFGLCLIADTRHVGSWVDEYHPRPPILHVDGPMACRRLLEDLVLEPERVTYQQEACLKWAKDHLTPSAIADHWEKALS